jgi:prevent-host-death family protein
MAKVWPLQEAKNKLSEVVDRALSEGPQVISRRGRGVAVVVSLDEFRRESRPATSLVEFLQSSPLFGVDLDVERSRDTGRDVGLSG